MANKSNHDWAVIFDLDETLVRTNALEPLRRSRAWGKVYDSFDQTTLPDGTIEFIRKLTQIAQLGVVTKAPSVYAKKLLAFYKIDIPVLAGYHEVKKRKPDPEGLLLASSLLGLPASRCIYVGDDSNDVIAARAAGFTPLGVCWGNPIEIGMKSVCKSWDQVYEEIVRIIKG
jgi:HAD superfamily hydrolase (TIGR01549 family)